MHKDVPILIPDVNPEHIHSAEEQADKLGFKKGGFIITNANCSTTSLTVAIKPLQDAFGIKKMFTTTMQVRNACPLAYSPTREDFEDQARGCVLVGLRCLVCEGVGGAWGRFSCFAAHFPSHRIAWIQL